MCMLVPALRGATLRDGYLMPSARQGVSAQNELGWVRCTAPLTDMKFNWQ